MALLNHRPFLSIPSLRSSTTNASSRISCFSAPTNSAESAELKSSKKEYSPGVVDDIFLKVFRSKMAQEIGWDSEKAGYDGLIDVAHRIMVGRSNSEATDAAEDPNFSTLVRKNLDGCRVNLICRAADWRDVTIGLHMKLDAFDEIRILRSLFPPLLLELYKMLISPIAGGKVAAAMVARVTAVSCQWLMGTCTVNSVDLPSGSSWSSGVFVEKCKYLEESKCVGVCINTCKLPTQAFFKEYMGVPLLMEPNFNDYSCQFKFGVDPPTAEEDAALKEPCLEMCPTAERRRQLNTPMDVSKCPKA